MKTRLIILFLLGALMGSAQTAQQKLDALKARMQTYKLADLPEEQQQDTITKWYQLEAAAIYETAQAEKAARISDSTAQAQAVKAYITHLKALGYKCDNSQADWRKAWKRPEWFGAAWQAKADAAWRASSGVKDFIAFCKQYGY